NVPFLRAVRPRERPEMTTVYATYRDTARLSAPGIFALVLQVFALPAVFYTSGLIMLGMAWYARYIPRRL
ncbi:MAG: MFS transporter, partial [Alphaproteobacteria bacterium]